MAKKKRKSYIPDPQDLLENQEVQDQTPLEDNIPDPSEPVDQPETMISETEEPTGEERFSEERQLGEQEPEEDNVVPIQEPQYVSEETKGAAQYYVSAVNDEQKAKQKAIREALNNFSFNQSLPQIFEQKKATLSQALTTAEDRLLSAPPVRSSLLNSGSGGETLLAAIFNVASGGSFLNEVKQSYNRDRIERREALSEYERVSNLYQQNEIAPLLYQQDMMNNYLTLLKVKQQLNPNDPMKKMQMEKALLEQEKIIAQIGDIKNGVVEGRAKKQLEREKFEHKKKVDAATIEFKKQQFVSKQASDVLKANQQADAQVQMQQRKELIPGKMEIGSVEKPNELAKVREKTALLRHAIPVKKEVLKKINDFSLRDMTSLSKRFSVRKGAIKEKFNLASGKEVKELSELRIFNNKIKTFFGATKDMLKLGRLSDWDALFVSNYLALADEKDVSGNLSYLSKSKLEKMKQAINSLSRSMELSTYEATVPTNPKTGERLSEKEFLTLLTSDTQKRDEERKSVDSPVKQKQKDDRGGFDNLSGFYEYLQGTKK